MILETVDFLIELQLAYFIVFVVRRIKITWIVKYKRFILRMYKKELYITKKIDLCVTIVDDKYEKKQYI